MLLNRTPPNNKDISQFLLESLHKKDFTSHMTRFGSSIHLPSLNRSCKTLVFLLRITKLWKYLVLSLSLSHCVLDFWSTSYSFLLGTFQKPSKSFLLYVPPHLVTIHLYLLLTQFLLFPRPTFHIKFPNYKNSSNSTSWSLYSKPSSSKDKHLSYKHVEFIFL